MELQKLKVKGLFGTFTHTIEFSKTGSITLLHGQNGLGKTVILKLIKAFFDQKFQEIRNYNFENLILYFSKGVEIRIKKELKADNYELRIERVVSKKKTDGPYYVKIPDKRRYISNRIIATNRARLYNDSEYFEQIFKKYIPFDIRSIGPGTWYVPTLQSMFSTNEIINRYRQFIPFELKYESEIPEWLKQVTESLKVIIIETQRLLQRIATEEGKYRSAVAEYSKEIIETIKEKRAQASDLAAKLDRSYPERLITKITNQVNISSDTLNSKLLQLEEKRKTLNFVGLIDAEDNYIQPNTREENNLVKNVLQLYIDDSNEKLAIYDNLSNKISLFLNLIKKRFLYKSFKIDKQFGFKFSSTIKSLDIPLSGLSSGEQHELVLFYFLLFKTQPGSLVLIDEPEISLHISWQKEFINDLKEVIKINNIEIVIATHSPDIIGKYWDLTVQLKGIEEK